MDIKNNSEVQNYIEEICSHIKNKRVHAEVREELLCHLEEKAVEYIKCGKGEEEAVQEAIKHMGASEKIGLRLDKQHKSEPEWSIFIMSIILAACGLAILYICKVTATIDNPMYIFKKSLLWSCIGFAALIGGSFVDYRKINKYSKYIYTTGVILLIMTIATATEFNGIRSWLVIGPIAINTGYIAPILFSIGLSGIYNNYNWSKRNNVIKGILLAALPVLLITLTKSITYSFIYYVELAVVMYAAKPDKLIKYSILIGDGCLIIVNCLIKAIKFSGDSSYVLEMLRRVRESSVLFGKAVNFKENLLPDAYGDFILSSIIYNFGWIAGMIVIALIIVLLQRMIKAARSVNNNYGRSLAVIITSILCVQLILHVISNLGITVVECSALPFLSYGGTNTVINMFIVGIVINIYKGKTISRVEI